jgi:hypothetical protein
VIASNKARKQWADWIKLVASTPGASCLISVKAPPRVKPIVVTWYSDAAVEGTEYPALAGYCHGQAWVYPLRKKLKKWLTIAKLELLCLLGNLMIFGNLMPSEVTILTQCDSLESVNNVINTKSKSKEMTAIFKTLTTRDEWRRLSPNMAIGHVWGEGNPLADMLSRGETDNLAEMCKFLHTKVTYRKVPPEYDRLVMKICGIARLTDNKRKRSDDMNRTPPRGGRGE